MHNLCAKNASIPWHEEFHGGNLPIGLTIHHGFLLGPNIKTPRFPPELHIYGDLFISRGDTVTLPNGLVVHGKLSLRGLTTTEDLPSDLTVRGALYLSRTTKVKTIPPNLGVTWVT